MPFAPDAERVNACDPDDLTRTEILCRRAARAHFDVLRSQMKGFENAWLDDYARMLGITESRRLVGDYVLRKEDGDVRFTDAIAQTGHWTRRNVVYDIPYRCLTTSVVDNLLVAGRCISTTRYVHQATKEIPAAMATGEAAGAAAAAASHADANSDAARQTPPDVRTIDVAALRSDLSARGAIVGPGIRAEATKDVMSWKSERRLRRQLTRAADGTMTAKLPPTGDVGGQRRPTAGWHVPRPEAR